MKGNPVISLKRIGKNVTYLMRKKGIDAQNLSDRTGVGIATINNLKRGSGNPTVATLSALAEFFNVSAGSLMESDLSCAALPDENVKVLPLINFNEIELFIYKKTSAKDTYTTEVQNPEDNTLFAVKITTSSLFPEIENGAICIISRDEKYSDGDIVLLNIRDSNLCFRRVFISEKGYAFSGVVLDTNTSIFEYEDYEIIGVMIKKINTLK